MQKSAKQLIFSIPGHEEILSKIEDKYGEQAYKKVVWTAVRQLKQLQEENKNEPDALKVHTWNNIYPMIAFYQGIQKVMEPKEAFQLLRRNYLLEIKKMARALHKLLKVPGLYKLVPRFAYKITTKKYGTNATFRYGDVESSKNHMKVDMLGCPYYNACNRYECPELTDIFCTADDIAYGDMHPRLIWGRTQTLGRGDVCCDFKITIK